MNKEKMTGNNKMLILQESQTVEFKKIWKDEYLKTICAFANTDGGSLYISVTDDGLIYDLEDIKDLVEILPNKINNRLGILVDLLVRQQENKKYIEIKVAKTFAPVSYHGKFYKRSGSNTLELNGSNLTNFLLHKYGKTWDDVAVEEFTLDEIDLLTIKKFKLLAKDRIPNIDKEDDLQELLKKLNLYDGKYLKRAAILLFAKDPQKYFIQSHSKIGRFLSETDIQSSDIIEGNLIDQVDKIMDVLRLKYLKAYISYEGMHRREKLEYPYDALKEAVINALIHRDYSNTSNLQIKVYDERLVMYNGATLSQEVPIERFGKPHQSKPFNPTIASVFYKAGFIENWGKGTLNIIDECVEYGLPIPTFEYEWTAVRTTFYKTKLTTQETTQETAQETAQENTKEKILELLRQNPKYTKSDLMQILDKADGTIKEHLSNLKKEGKLKRVGSTKSGYWEVNNDK